MISPETKTWSRQRRTRYAPQKQEMLYSSAPYQIDNEPARTSRHRVCTKGPLNVRLGIPVAEVPRSSDIDRSHHTIKDMKCSRDAPGTPQRSRKRCTAALRARLTTSRQGQAATASCTMGPCGCSSRHPLCSTAALNSPFRGGHGGADPRAPQ
jgi:hypothetical protein